MKAKQEVILNNGNSISKIIERLIEIKEAEGDLRCSIYVDDIEVHSQIGTDEKFVIFVDDH